VICRYMNHRICIASIDYALYPLTVLDYTDRLPTLCLFIAGIPLLYTGSLHVGDIHIWLKTQIQPAECPIIAMPISTPTPTSTPMPTPSTTPSLTR